MRFSTHSPLAVALTAASLASATPLHGATPVSERTLGLLNGGGESGGLLSGSSDSGSDKTISEHISIDQDLSGKILVDGFVAVNTPVASAAQSVEVSVACKECYTHGSIDAEVSLEKLVPAISLSIKDVEAYLDLDVKFSAGTTIAVNLFAPPTVISLPIAGLKIGAMIYVDLVLAVTEALEFSGGLYVNLVEEAILETDILSGEILKAAFSGVSVRTLPIEVRLGCATFKADLRLRVELAAKAEVDDLPLLEGLGIDLPDIGVGVAVGVFANLFEYTALMCAVDDCPVSVDTWAVNVGAAVLLDIEVEDILTLAIAPTISTALLSLPTQSHCELGPNPTYMPYPSPSISSTIGSVSSSATASVPTGSGSGSGSGSGIVTAPYTTAPGDGNSNPSVTSPPGSSPTPGGGDGSDDGSDDGSGDEYHTSTVKSTTHYTVTACAATVANCPSDYQSEQVITKTVDVYTTVCPKTMSVTAPATTSTAAAVPGSSTKSDTVKTITKDVTVLVPCSSVETFTPPTDVPTVPANPTGAVPATPSASSATSPAMGSPSSGAPQPSISHPAGGASSTAHSHPAASPSYPGAGSPTNPAAPMYPTTYPVFVNSTTTVCPETLSTVSKPSVSLTYPLLTTTASSMPITSAPVAAGASKAGGRDFVGALALVAAVAVVF